jgi:hypothetical protein
VLTASAVQAQDAVTLKPGLWESRIIKLEVNGEDHMPQLQATQARMRQSIASMPLQHREKLEAMSGPDQSVERSCVSSERWARTAGNDRAFFVYEKISRKLNLECVQPRESHNGNRITFEVSCQRDGSNTLTMKTEYVIAGDQATVKTEILNTAAGGAKPVMIQEAQMQFLGSDCGDLKPVPSFCDAVILRAE